MKDALKTERLFTETYKRHRNDHPAIREAECQKAQYPAIMLSIRDGDLFAGRKQYAGVGFSPHSSAGLGYYCSTGRLLPHGNEGAEIAGYWAGETTNDKVRQSYSRQLLDAFPYDGRDGEFPGIVFPLYRLAGLTLDFGKLIELGIPGMLDYVYMHKKKAVDSEGDVQLYQGMEMALELLRDVCQFYAIQAIEQAERIDNECRRSELLEMSTVLRQIRDHRPNNLREAIQLLWLYALLADVRNYGRMDVYLGDYLQRDLDSGFLSERQALAYLQSLWKLIADRVLIFDGRIIVGGLGRRNPYNADRFAIMAMEATRTVKETEPQLSLRCYTGMNPVLLDKALEVIGEGRTYPILYNDDVNVPAVEKAFSVNRFEAEQYVPYGCGEYILEHRSVGTPSGVINLLKALEVTLHNGVDPVSGKPMGLALGDADRFETFDDLLEAYKQQVEHYVGIMAEQEALEYRIAGENSPYLYPSMLYEDCMERGRGIFAGGIRYLGGTLESYGNISTADSLTAIKELVYDRKRMSLNQLVQILDANFAGYESERALLRSVPKFGNDHPAADSMAAEIHDHICLTAKAQGERVGLHSYLVVVINNSMNTILGKLTLASADGRKSGEPLSNANAPSGGSDKKGITAVLNSMAKLDPSIHAGAVHNLKFGRDLFAGDRKHMKTLLKTYFAKGGTQAMITVVSRDELEQAMVEPEKYTHLFVRVGGFSARFVELSRDVQLDILSRTLY